MSLGRYKAVSYRKRHQCSPSVAYVESQGPPEPWQSVQLVGAMFVAVWLLGLPVVLASSSCESAVALSVFAAVLCHWRIAGAAVLTRCS